MASYLITGSSRGLGLAIAGFLASKPAAEVGKVFASARSESAGIRKLVAEHGSRVEYVQLDTTSQEGAQKAAGQVAQSLGSKGLDVLINNAGVMPFAPGGLPTMNDLDETFKINVTGVHYVTAAFLPLLEKGNLKKILNVSTTVGSMGLSHMFSQSSVPAYKITKAALNMLTVQWAYELADKGFTVVAFSPGWIRTEMGGEAADLTIEEGTRAVGDLIFGVTKEDNGKFLNVKVEGWEKPRGPVGNYYDGASPPW